MARGSRYLVGIDQIAVMVVKDLNQWPPDPKKMVSPPHHAAYETGQTQTDPEGQRRYSSIQAQTTILIVQSSRSHFSKCPHALY